MRKSFLIIILTGFGLISFSQDFDRVYYNGKWEITSQKYAEYYRKSGFDEILMAFDSVVTDFYLNDYPEMTGMYLNGKKEGEFRYYYPDQTLKMKISYQAGERYGVWTEYYPDGRMFKEVSYEDNMERLVQYNDENGGSMLKNLSGKFIMRYYHSSYFDAFSVYKHDSYDTEYTLTGNLKNGLKNGAWILRDEFRIICKINYKNGIRQNGVYYLDYGSRAIGKDVFTYLFSEPEKTAVTEEFFAEQGQMIKQNYLLKVLYKPKEGESSKIIISSEEELSEYFSINYSLFLKNCADTFRMNIKLRVNDRGKVTIDSISPEVQSQFEKEASRVIGTIDRIEGVRNKEITIGYQVMCNGQLDYKR